MEIHEIGKGHSLAAQYISELRDVNIQQDRMRFRRNLERLGEICAYEISKQLKWKDTEVETPLGTAPSKALADQPVLAAILRAGLAMHHGMLNYFDNADNAFISAYRKHDRDGTFEVQVEYMSCPGLEGRTLIMSDPMLATGSSMVLSLQALRRAGKPVHTHIVSAIAAMDGIEHVRKNITNATLWVGAIDEELTAKAYIVPGLGDAGDLAYGSKVQE